MNHNKALEKLKKEGSYSDYLDALEGLYEFEHCPGDLRKQHQIYAMSNLLARVPKKMSLIACKIYAYVLTKISFTANGKNKKTEDNNLIVTCPFSEMMKDLEFDNSNWSFYKKQIKEMENKAFVDYEDEKEFCRTRIFKRISFDKENNQFTFYFNDLLTKELTNLSSMFTIYPIGAIPRFRSNYSFILYWHLMSHLGKAEECSYVFSTKGIKELFGLEKDQYTRIDKRENKRSFNRSVFERKCLDIVFKDILEATQGQYFTYVQKIKQDKKSNSKVLGYKITLSKKQIKLPDLIYADKNARIDQKFKDGVLDNKIMNELLEDEEW